MKFDKFNFINDKELLRLTGAKKATFNKMLNILQVVCHNKKWIYYLNSLILNKSSMLTANYKLKQLN